MSHNTQTINQLSRQIKILKNRARTANQQKKWGEERYWLGRIQALNIKRKNLQTVALQARIASTEISPRTSKKITILQNEIARDTRILQIHKTNNNIPGVKKYENILKNKQAKLALLQNDTGSISQPCVNNNRKIRVLLNEIRRDKNILERHQQANNAAGVTKYKAIVQAKQAELQRLRHGNHQPAEPSADDLGYGEPSTDHPGSDNSANASTDEQEIAQTYISNKNIEIAYRSVIDLLLTEAQFAHLKDAKDTLFVIKGNTAPPVSGSVIDQPFIRDAFKILKSNVVLDGYTVKDSIFETPFPAAFDATVTRINALIGTAAAHLKPYKQLAHRDAFQFIPQDTAISRAWSQFAGAKLDNISAQNISIHSPGSLQGLFSSDGAYENFNLKNISIDTQSAHQVVILGLLSGTLDLSNDDGSRVRVELLPLRLGGGTNIYILGFSDSSSYQYGSVDGGSSNVDILDNREVKTKPGTYYTHFDMDHFIDLISAEPQQNLTDFLTLIKKSAELSGDLVA